MHTAIAARCTRGGAGPYGARLGYSAVYTEGCTWGVYAGMGTAAVYMRYRTPAYLKKHGKRLLSAVNDSSVRYMTPLCGVPQCA